METNAAPTIDAMPPHPPLVKYYRGGKKEFLGRIFDLGASDYDRVEKIVGLGTGSWYRRQALIRAGLSGGMRVLDVAIGTGLVAREAVALTGDPKLVLGVDPSAGMLAQAAKVLGVPVVRAVGEHLPIADSVFDFVSMGYALRHLSDLNVAFAEFRRVLKPGGRLCVLELVRPTAPVGRALLRFYMRGIVPMVARIVARDRDSRLLWDYYWDTIEACVPPEQVLAAMTSAGFTSVRRYTELGVFSEFVATNAASASS